MNKIILFSIFCIFSSFNYLSAQELNARVNVNSDRIQGTNKEVFTSLQSALNTFINGTKWSSTTFSSVEKIDCTFNIIILNQSESNTYTAEISVVARRPVYNSTYTTSILNFRDTKLDFEYMENSPLELDMTNITSNLIATVAFYCNLILGLDFDSFSPRGGSYFFRQAQNITMQAQGSSWMGWTAFESTTNRHAIITAFTDESLVSYRDFWYTYHRKGLDEMASNPDRGRTTIIQALSVLNELKNMRSSSVLLQMFADSKLEEVVLMCNKASSEEKKEVYDLFYKLYPTMTDRLEPLKK